MRTNPECPTCGVPLHRVRRESGSMLNADQFDSVKAGDWFCDTCPNNGRGSPDFCYWWDSELKAAADEPPAAVVVTDEHRARAEALRPLVVGTGPWHDLAKHLIDTGSSTGLLIKLKHHVDADVAAARERTAKLEAQLAQLEEINDRLRDPLRVGNHPLHEARNEFLEEHHEEHHEREKGLAVEIERLEDLLKRCQLWMNSLALVQLAHFEKESRTTINRSIEDALNPQT